MGTQFEWQFDNDIDPWRTAQQTDGRDLTSGRRRWLLRWVWITFVAVALVSLVAGYAVIRRRYDEAHRWIVFQIQGTIDQEARAFEQRDRDLYLAQIDRQAMDWWYREQRGRIHENCQGAHGVTSPLLDKCYPVLPAQVEDIELRDQVALVEVVEGDPPVRRARFYRRTDQGWLHTSPRPDLNDPPVEIQYGGLTARCHRRDLPHVQPLLEYITGTMNETCAMVGCSSDSELVVEFVVRQSIGGLPRLEGAKILVDTPWLLGIPTNRAVDDAYLDKLTHLSTYASVYRAMHVAADQEPTPLQRAIADEYVAWHGERDTTQAPLLGRIADRHGVDALPAVMRSLAGVPSLSTFLRNWLDIAPNQDSKTFFQTLLDIEHEALLAGRKETFLLLQVQPDPEIQGAQRQMPQETVYLDMHLQHVDGFDQLPAVEVTSVETAGNLAYVTLRPSRASRTSWPPVEFYRLQDGAWKHTMPYYAQDYGRMLTSGSAEAVQDDRITIRFGCRSYEREQFTQWAEIFYQRHPGIRIEIVSIEEIVPPLVYTADSQRELAFRLLSQVDVVAGFYTRREAIDQGWVHDLDPFIEQADNFDAADFMPGLLEQNRWEGRTWALPTNAHLWLIYYDKGAFDDGGIPYPQAGWTQEEFLTTAQALTERRGRDVIRYGYIDGSQGGFTWIKSRAGSVMDDASDPPRPDLTAPRVVEAVRWYTNLATQHQIMPYPQALGFEENNTDYYRALRESIDRKHTAMWSDSTWSWGYRRQRFRLGAVPYPVGVRPVNALSASSYVMSANTAHPQESWLWLAFLTHQCAPHSSQFGPVGIPVRRSVAQEPDYWAQLEPELAETLRYVLKHPQGLSAGDPIAPVHHAVQAIYGGLSVEKALAEAQTQAIEYLDER
jgi:multiple sugar transport system substrate-binding protein